MSTSIFSISVSSKTQQTLEVLLLHGVPAGSRFDSLGGIYIESNTGDDDHEVASQCTTSQPILEPCLYLEFKSVLVKHNKATISGGGVFVTSSKKLAPFCIVGPNSLSIPCPESEDSYLVRLQQNTIRVSAKAAYRSC